MPYTSSALPSSIVGRFPGAVLGSDDNYAACLTLEIQSNVCSQSVANFEYNDCQCWTDQHAFWGATHNALATSCASFWGSFYGKDETVSRYLSLGKSCPATSPTTLCYTYAAESDYTSCLSSLQSTSTSRASDVPLWPGFVSAPSQAAMTASPASIASHPPTPTSSSDALRKQPLSVLEGCILAWVGVVLIRLVTY